MSSRKLSRLRITTLLVPNVRVGDWVLIHAGFAIQSLDPESAARTWSVLEQAAAADAGETQ